MPAQEREKALIAYHEAGHVVLLLALGRTITRAGIWQNHAGGWEGITYCLRDSRTDDELSVNDHLQHFMARRAGPIAEKRYSGSSEEHPRHLHDYAKAQEALQSACRQSGLGHCMREGESRILGLIEVTLAENWRVVDAVAALFLGFGALTGAELAALLYLEVAPFVFPEGAFGDLLPNPPIA